MSDSQRDTIIAHVWLVGSILEPDWMWAGLMFVVSLGWLANAIILQRRDR